MKSKKKNSTEFGEVNRLLIDYLPLLSLDFGLKPLYPHFLQVFALIGFLALHLIQIFTLKSLASASANLAMNVQGCREYLSIAMRCN